MNPDIFFLVKGVIGVTGTALLLIHMNISWKQFDLDCKGIRTGIAQRCRFFCLFGFCVLITAASYQQIKENFGNITTSNIGGLILGVFVIFTTIVSIIEADRAAKRRH